VIACGSDEEATDQGGAATEVAPSEVEVTAADFSFAPTKLTGNVGREIEVTLANTGDAPHTFTIDEYNVDVEIAAGEEMIVTVIPSEPGEFNFYCRFHQAQGMQGAISTTGEAGEDEAAEEPTAAPEDDPYTY
jgi:plastocyanin